MTSDDLKGGRTNPATVLFTQMGELLEQGMCDRAERKVQFAPEQFTVLLGSIDMLKRNAHTEPRSLASGHNADWSALLAEGGIRPFVTSVITALYHEGNTTSIDRLMQCMCGTYYSGDINNLGTTAGAKGVYFGAFVHFQVRGHSQSVAAAMRGWVTFVSKGPDGSEMPLILGLPTIFKQVIG